MSIEIELKKYDRTYIPGDLVAGTVVVISKGATAHTGITLVMEGISSLQLSAKSVGLFEAFYNSIKPIELVNVTVQVAPPGKVADGRTEYPFEFKLEPMANKVLYETYHGVFVNITYKLRADMVRGALAKNLRKELEFIVEVPDASKIKPPEAHKFSMTPDALENVKKTSLKNIPKFSVKGQLDTTCCEITCPFQGSLVVEECEIPIQSIELQLVRVETCGCADGYAKEDTEIQNIQVADGDVTRGSELPIYMVFPRLFTCPSMVTRTFKIEFEINLVVMFQDNRLVTENFPITLVRSGQQHPQSI